MGQVVAKVRVSCPGEEAEEPQLPLNDSRVPSVP